MHMLQSFLIPALISICLGSDRALGEVSVALSREAVTGTFEPGGGSSPPHGGFGRPTSPPKTGERSPPR